MSKLWAVQGDPNTHSGGQLIAENPQTVFVNSIPVIEHEDPAQPDSLCPASPHCNPKTAEGAPSVFVYSNPVHRHDDDRICGATTVVELQSTVFVGDLSVSNGSAVLVEGVLVATDPYSAAGSNAIVNEGAGAAEDDEGGEDGAPTSGGGSNPRFSAYSSPNDRSTQPGAPTSPSTVDNSGRQGDAPERRDVDTSNLPSSIDYNYRLSTNYTVKDFTLNCVFKHQLQSQKGYSIQDLMGNLKYLAENVAEPVNRKYPGIRINSGFRQGSSGSQHCNGMAMDIQWPGLAPRDYLPRAQWIRDNIDYDQIIFEHGNTIWIHLSYDRNKSKQRGKVTTMYKGNYESGLKLYYS
jgi:zinc D-Ala-D-Ala carboxypeptidase